MAAISVSEVTWATPDGRTVLNGIDLALARERAGLVGRNGVGKSTLLHIIAGDLDAHAGHVTRTGTVRLMRQEVDAGRGRTVADLFGAADALGILRRAEAGEASLDDLADADWTIEDRIHAALADMALEGDASTPLDKYSGGQRTRLALSAAIFRKPDFLLLDEPTNNLDTLGREAVRRLVAEWDGGLIVVSHDRELLDCMDAIVELTTLGAARYGGNWTRYRERKAVELDAAEHRLAHAQRQQAEIERKAHLASERKAKRDLSGSRKGARGDMPRILAGARRNAAEASGGSERRLSERMSANAAEAVEEARAQVEILQHLSIVLPATGLPPGRTVLKASGLAAGYGSEALLFQDVDLEMTGAERIAITGPNGAGKSTLLKVLSGALEPLRGHAQVHVPYAVVDQEVSFLKRDETVLDNFRRLNPDAGENACRAALAGFLFRADAALQKVGTLSGGQMLRAGLACRLGGAAPPQLLVLDEPTNHLDLESIDAVESALTAYDGAILVVSHDERFLSNISVTRRVHLVKGTPTIVDPAMERKS